MREVHELSYEHDGRWDARYGKCGRLLIKDGFSILGINMGDGQDIHTLGNVFGHVPLTVLNQPFVPPAFALVLVPSSFRSFPSTTIPSGSPLAHQQCVSKPAHLL
jgi:hypothetical protein